MSSQIKFDQTNLLASYIYAHFNVRDLANIFLFKFLGISLIGGTFSLTINQLKTRQLSQLYHSLFM